MMFTRSRWPNLEEREYRVSQGQDAAAALVIDGQVVAAGAQERFNRKKHSELFPQQAIEFCLNKAGINLDDVQEIAHSFDYFPYRAAYRLSNQAHELYRNVFSREAIVQTIHEHLPSFPPHKIQHVSHHLAHAASAYYTSGWDDCVVVVIDAMGEIHGISCFRGKNGKLEKLSQMSARDSIGMLYSLITMHLGFDFNSDEYKIMGLAPYGDPAVHREFFSENVILLENGSIRIPILATGLDRWNLPAFAGLRERLNIELIPARDPSDAVTQDHCDVAAALQECLDRTIQHVCCHLSERTGVRKLAMAGGVALNCTANGKLLRSGFFEGLYVQPAAGDDGSALGAALYRAAQAGEIRNRRMPLPYLGPEASEHSIAAALLKFKSQISVVAFENVEQTCAEAARQIAAGKVVGWFRGRMEFGPRALGNRSLLADARNPQMRDRVNAMVKMREAFRPFAPAVTREHACRIFDVPGNIDLPYMIMIVGVRPPFRDKLPAITHVDGTARVQTVSAADNPAFYMLLREVGRHTGIEVVLNTSFNVKGQPIVNTAEEAIETFLGTGVDSLFLENHLITKAQPASVNETANERGVGL
jgi:carbamoyltransferase